MKNVISRRALDARSKYAARNRLIAMCAHMQTLKHTAIDDITNTHDICVCERDSAVGKKSSIEISEKYNYAGHLGDTIRQF